MLEKVYILNNQVKNLFGIKFVQFVRNSQINATQIEIFISLCSVTATNGAVETKTF